MMNGEGRSRRFVLLFRIRPGGNTNERHTRASHHLATGVLFSKWAIPKPAMANSRIRGRCDSASQASCDYPQFRSGVRVFEKFAYVRSPNVQRLFTLREELVPLIDGRHP